MLEEFGHLSTDVVEFVTQTIEFYRDLADADSVSGVMLWELGYDGDLSDKSGPLDVDLEINAWGKRWLQSTPFGGKRGKSTVSSFVVFSRFILTSPSVIKI